MGLCCSAKLESADTEFGQGVVTQRVACLWFLETLFRKGGTMALYPPGRNVETHRQPPSPSDLTRKYNLEVGFGAMEGGWGEGGELFGHLRDVAQLDERSSLNGPPMTHVGCQRWRQPTCAGLLRSGLLRSGHRHSGPSGRATPLQNRPLARYIGKPPTRTFDHMSASARQSFQVVFCTGSDAGFPVTELNEHSPHTKGWQSPRFCEYPQEIGIEHVKK